MLMHIPGSGVRLRRNFFFDDTLQAVPDDLTAANICYNAQCNLLAPSISPHNVFRRYYIARGLNIARNDGG
jgi:hypothetical protein